MSKIKKVIKQILLKTVFKWKLIYAYNQYRKKVDRQYILFGIPEHGNIGDHAIAIAEREFLKDLGIADVFEVPIQKQSAIIKTIQKKILPNDIILITGGGFIGNQWMTEENMVREVVKTFPNNKTIIFPSTIYYKDDEEGKKEFEKSREIYNTHQNLVICAREKKTYDFILKNYPQIKALLAPDIVLYLDRSEKGQERNNEILLCLRADPEKNITDQQTKYIDEISQKYGQVRYIDTVIHRRVNPKDREMVLTEKLNEFSAAKLVITDRLHGMIFAAITGTPCIALGNYNYKVRGVYEWIKNLNYVKFVEQLDEIEVLIQELVQNKDYQYPKISEESWKPLIEEIKKYKE